MGPVVLGFASPQGSGLKIERGLRTQVGPGLAVIMLTSVHLCNKLLGRLRHNVSTDVSSHSVDDVNFYNVLK